MSDQFEVLFYGFGGQSVLSEDKVFSVDESVYLTHCHVWQEVLEKEDKMISLLSHSSSLQQKQKLDCLFKRIENALFLRPASHFDTYH